MSQADVCNIYATQEQFGDYFFDEENVDVKNTFKIYDYEPRIYPMYMFREILTDNIKNILEIWECFPEVNNKPIFDFYGVIVPSLNFPKVSNNKYYSFIDCHGLRRVYEDNLQAKYEFDKYMIANKYFRPIIVAEKDHKCYFISYWV